LSNEKTILRAALSVAVIGSFFTPFMGSSINIALPVIGKQLGMNAVSLGWVASAFLLASSMILVPVGRIADLVGRKKVYLTGVLVFTVATTLCALSYTGSMLILSRALQGLGSAMMFTTSLALVLSVYPKERRGRAVGYVTGTTYVGLALGPSLGGFLTEYLGWQSIFYLMIPVGMVIILIILLFLKGDWAEAKGERFDWKGAVFYSFGILGLIYGLSHLPSDYSVTFTLSGLVLLSVFVYLQYKNEHPLLNIRMLIQNKIFAFSNLAAFINYSATFGVGFILSLFLQYAKGFTPKEAGMILVSQPVVMAVFTPLFGRLSDRIDPRILASLGMAVSSVGLFFLSFIDKDIGLTYIIGFLMFLGLGFALFSSPNTNAVMSSVEKRFLGIASATLSTMRLLGQMISMVIVMFFINFFVGKIKITPAALPAFMKTVNVSLLLFAVLCFAGVFASLARGKRKMHTGYSNN